MPKINIGGEIIKVVRHGSDLVKEVYIGSDLIYRAFHNFIEGYNGVTILPAQGNGSRLIVPEYTLGTPPGEYFNYYDFGGNEVYPGDVIIYPDDPLIGEDWDLQISGQETPYYYTEHLIATYSTNNTNPEGSSSSTVNIVGFDIDMNGIKKSVTYSDFYRGDSGDSFSYTLNSI